MGAPQPVPIAFEEGSVSSIVPKDKIIELVEALFRAGYEVEAFKVCEYDNYFIVIELQISKTQDKTLKKLVDALFQAGYEVEELNPVCES